MYIYIQTYFHKIQPSIHLYMNMHACMHAYITCITYIYTYVRTNTHMRIRYTYIHTNTITDTDIRTYIRTWITARSVKHGDSLPVQVLPCHSCWLVGSREIRRNSRLKVRRKSMKEAQTRLSGNLNLLKSCFCL